MSVIKTRFNLVVDEMHDHCPHLKVGDVATVTYIESDSFGTVGKMSHCTECYDGIKDECHDCGQEFKDSELKEWTFRCTDGDPSISDTLKLCDSCLNAEHHRKRDADDLATDRAENPEWYRDLEAMDEDYGDY